MRASTKTIIVGMNILLAACLMGCKKKDAGADASFSTEQQPGGYQQQPGGYQQQPGGYQQQPGGYQQQPGGYQQQPGGYQQPGSTTQQPGGYQQPPTQPTATSAQPPGGAPASGGACSPNPALAPAAQPILQAIGQQNLVSGSRPLGQAMACQLQAGQVMEQQIQLQPGKCYSVVAAGLPPVTNVDVQLVLKVQGLPLPPGVLAQDQDQSAQTVLGKKPNCFQWALPMPVPATVVVRAASGNGLVAAQVYEK